MWRGTRGPEEATGNLTFHGRFILEGVVSHLIKNQDLGQIKQFVLMGFSAGAAGVATNCDYVAGRIRAEVNNTVDVRCIMYSGDLFPYWIHEEECDPMENYKMYNQFWHGKLV